MPVVRTPVLNRTSYFGSRATRARSHSAKSSDIPGTYPRPFTNLRPIRGWSPVLASNSGLAPLHLMVGLRTVIHPLRDASGTNVSRFAGDEIAAAPKHRSKRRDSRMHPLRVWHAGRVARECGLQYKLFLRPGARACCRRVANHLC